MNLNSFELKVFRTIVEENGFQRASKKLFVSQSAVSQSLSGLEEKLDMKLIIRKGPLALTDAGKRLLRYAYTLFSNEKEVLEELENLKQGVDITLSIAINSTIDQFYAEDLVYMFCQQHQAAKLQVDILPSREIISTILSGRRELGFGPFQTQMDAFETVPFFEGQRYLVVSKNCPHYTDLKQGKESALKNVPLITKYLDDPDLRPSMEKMRDLFSTVWEISSERLLMALVEKGLGLTFIGQKLLSDNPNYHNLTKLKKYKFGEIKRTVGIYYKKGVKLSEGAQQFIEICKRYWHSAGRYSAE